MAWQLDPPLEGGSSALTCAAPRTQGADPGGSRSTRRYLQATLSRYETKEGAVKWPAVDALCREYGASDEERLALVDLAKGARIQAGGAHWPTPSPSP